MLQAVLVAAALVAAPLHAAPLIPMKGTHEKLATAIPQGEEISARTLLGGMRHHGMRKDSKHSRAPRGVKKRMRMPENRSRQPENRSRQPENRSRTPHKKPHHAVSHDDTAPEEEGYDDEMSYEEEKAYEEEMAKDEAMGEGDENAAGEQDAEVPLSCCDAEMRQFRSSIS
jgi:hypothetical protein